MPHISDPDAPASRAERRRVQNNVPQSPEVAEQNLAAVIGQSVAAHLGQVLAQMPWQPECLFCCMAAKKLITDYEVAVRNAGQAGEPVPDQPERPAVSKALTWVNVAEQVPGPGGPQTVVTTVPSCWDHVPVPGSAPRQTGLVAPDGRPIMWTP